MVVVGGWMVNGGGGGWMVRQVEAQILVFERGLTLIPGGVFFLPLSLQEVC